jgi:hypothetical protein
MRQTITCARCGGEIGPHWQAVQHVSCEPGQLTPEQQREIAAMERRLQARIVERRLWNTGIIVTRKEEGAWPSRRKAAS